MRRHPGHLHRQPKAKTSAVVASLILVLLVLIAIAARFTGSDSSLTYLTESEGTELYLQSPLLQSSLLQDHNGVFAQASSLLSNAAAVTPVPKQPEPALAPKLQSNVLSSFNVNPVTASLPSNPEQTAFVRGYQQLKPVLSATSYIPLSLHTTRGIILPAGKSLRLGSAYVALQLLRETLQCDLPIEIWHLTGEIDTHTKAVFEVKLAALCYLPKAQCASPTCACAPQQSTASAVPTARATLLPVLNYLQLLLPTYEISLASKRNSLQANRKQNIQCGSVWFADKFRRCDMQRCHNSNLPLSP